MTAAEKTHEHDADRDRCACGGAVVYHDRPGVSGDGCEVEGRPWRWTFVDDPTDPDYDPDGGFVYRRRAEGPYRGLVTLDYGTWYAVALVAQPGVRYYSDGSGEPPYDEDHELGEYDSRVEAQAAVDRFVDAVAGDDRAEEEIRRAEAEAEAAEYRRDFVLGETYGAEVDPFDPGDRP